MKRLYVDLILIGLILTLILVLFKIYIEIKSDGVACIANPLVYGANYYSESTGHDLSCTCSYNSQLYSPFRVTRNNTSPINQGSSQTNPDLDNVNITLWKAK